MRISTKFETTPEILGFIHNNHLKNQTSREAFITWQCVCVTGFCLPEWDKELNEWSDAAYHGDWDTLFQIAARTAWVGSFANCTRLRPKPDLEGSVPVGQPSGYTALHQAAWHGAPVEIAQGLIELGASCGIRTTDGKNQRPLDIAREKGHKHLYAILSIDLLPQVSDDELAEVERHFHAVILEEARGVFKLESMQLPQLGMLRDKPRITMQIPGMYGGFTFWWEEGHLVSQSYCRVAGGSGRTNHITRNKAELVEEGWG